MPRNFMDDPQRNDPELRKKVDVLLTLQNKALQDAAAALKEISRQMRELSIECNPIFDRCEHAVTMAYITVSRDAEFMNRDNALNENYIGNMAAGQMGDYLMKFRVPAVEALLGE